MHRAVAQLLDKPMEQGFECQAEDLPDLDRSPLGCGARAGRRVLPFVQSIGHSRSNVVEVPLFVFQIIVARLGERNAPLPCRNSHHAAETLEKSFALDRQGLLDRPKLPPALDVFTFDRDGTELSEGRMIEFTCHARFKSVEDRIEIPWRRENARALFGAFEPAHRLQARAIVQGRDQSGRIAARVAALFPFLAAELVPADLEQLSHCHGAGEVGTRIDEELRPSIDSLDPIDEIPHLVIERAALLRAPEDMGGAGKLDKLGHNATGVASLLGGAAVVAAIVGVTVPGVTAATMSVAILILAAAALGIGWGLNWFGRDRTTDALDDVRGVVQERLAALSRPLVVFVDDIDRLEPEQIRLVIRQIKANASLPNINFVLLFQPSIVEEALRPVSAGDGRDYLEKIVRANFDLPPVPADRLLQIFLQQLSAMIDPLATPENGFEQTRWGNVLRGGIEPMIRNLRDSWRLLTSIAIHIEMHKGEHAHEVNIIDFVALEALRVFEPALHRALSTKKTLLTQSGRFNGDNRQGGDGAEVTALLELVSEARRPACGRMLKELFTPIEWALGGMHYGDDFRPDWLRVKRVCTKRYFDRYFALQIAGDVISESDFVQFTQSAGDPVALALMVSSFAERNLLAALANRLDQSVNELPLDNPVPLLAFVFGNGEQLGRNDRSPLNDPFVASWRSAIRYLARLPDSAIRRDVFSNAFKASDAMAVSAFVLSLEDDALNKPGAGRTANFTVEDLEQFPHGVNRCGIPKRVEV